MIQEILLRLNSAYQKRDINIINEDLCPSDNIVFLGTGNEELAIGHQQCRELLESDFLYWGDVELDLATAKIMEIKDDGYFTVKGSVTTEFKDSNKRNLRYLDFVKKTLDESSDPLPLLNLVLGLTYHKRSGRIRKNKWPLIISGVITNGKISKLHFSLALEELANLDSQIKNLDLLKSVQLSEYKLEQYFPYQVTFLQSTIVDNFLIVSGFYTPSVVQMKQKYLAEIQSVLDESTKADEKILKIKQSVLYGIYHQSSDLKIPFRLTACLVNHQLCNVHISQPHYYILEDLKTADMH